MPSHKRRPSKASATIARRRLAAVIGGAVVVIAVVIAVVLGTGGGNKNPSATSSNQGAPGSTAPSLPSNRCPLTDTPAPGGTVPARIPLAVKIGNEPGPNAGGLGAARPQSGLNEADVVYDTPAEGGIMRYVAIYQCQSASLIGPVRSERWVDWHILAQFRTSILAHVGGIQPELALLDAQKYILNADAFTYPSAYQRTSNRVAPDNDYTSTSALYSLFSKYKTPPQPIFAYSAALPAGAKPVSSLAVNYSGGTDIVWRWDAATGRFLHFYQSVPDIDTLTNKQVSTTNIVVQIVNYKLGPYAESPGGSGDVESVTTGSGKGYVLRGGQMIPVTWHRPTLSSSTTYTSSSGAKVGLAPGRTWVEMVLNTTAAVPGAVTFTP